jgi:hypothetical protein
MAQTTQKTRVTCETASSLVHYQQWTWRGRHRKQSLIYCYVLDRVYRTVAWQRVDQIRYSIVAKLYYTVHRLPVILFVANSITEVESAGF